MNDKTRSFTVDLWKCSTGDILHYEDVVTLNYDKNTGVRRVKFLKSNQIRTIKDIAIFRINDIDVYL